MFGDELNYCNAVIAVVHLFNYSSMNNILKCKMLSFLSDVQDDEKINMSFAVVTIIAVVSHLF